MSSQLHRVTSGQSTSEYKDELITPTPHLPPPPYPIKWACHHWSICQLKMSLSVLCRWWRMVGTTRWTGHASSDLAADLPHTASFSLHSTKKNMMSHNTQLSPPPPPPHTHTHILHTAASFLHSTKRTMMSHNTQLSPPPPPAPLAYSIIFPA